MNWKGQDVGEQLICQVSNKMENLFASHPALWSSLIFVAHVLSSLSSVVLSLGAFLPVLPKGFPAY